VLCVTARCFLVILAVFTLGRLGVEGGRGTGCLGGFSLCTPFLAAIFSRATAMLVSTMDHPMDGEGITTFILLYDPFPLM